MVFDFTDLNLWAILAASVVPFLIGFLWYGPLFGKTWQKEVGLSDKDMKDTNMMQVFGLSFLANLVAVYVLAGLLNKDLGNLDWVNGATVGLWIGLAFQATVLATHYLFTRSSLKQWIIDSVYSIVTITAAGAILGAMLV